MVAPLTGHLRVVSGWVSYQQAAHILGCHVSNVPKLVARGELTSTGKRGRSFARDQVEDLARRRAEEREARTSLPPRKYQRVDHRPDLDHEWLTTSQVAELLGVTKPAVVGRITRDRCRQSGTKWATAGGGRLNCKGPRRWALRACP